jgi:hypothetical protein
MIQYGWNPPFVPGRILTVCYRPAAKKLKPKREKSGGMPAPAGWCRMKNLGLNIEKRQLMPENFG